MEYSGVCEGDCWCGASRHWHHVTNTHIRFFHRAPSGLSSTNGVTKDRFNVHKVNLPTVDLST